MIISDKGLASFSASSAVGTAFGCFVSTGIKLTPRKRRSGQTFFLAATPSLPEQSVSLSLPGLRRPFALRDRGPSFWTRSVSRCVANSAGDFDAETPCR